MKTLFFTVVLVFGAMFFAHAQSTPRVHQKQDNQVNRIQQGVQSGELTRAEAGKLARDQRQIQQKKNLAKADGVVTPRERRHIRRDQRASSADIYRQKNDRQSRR
jgi:hypothetical protein